ncbi:MAG: hypothetical protein DIU61_008170 [Bacteroidota bacterium]|jgi:hypothetical protein|nr:MAG: hypothetical protein DIU61_08310 [Bacteroidota bacterium]
MIALRYSTFILCLVLVGTYVAQGQAYVKLSGGYGFPLASEHLGTSGRQELTTSLDPELGFEVPRLFTESENVHGSYGSGVLINASFGYMFTDQIGVEGMVSYFIGREYHVQNSGLSKRLDAVLYDSRFTMSMQGKGFFFAPMAKLAANSGKIQPYLMIGPVFGKLYFDRSQRVTTYDVGLTSTQYAAVEYRGGLAKGARGIAGAEITIKSSLHFFAEALITGMNYYPSEAEVTRWEANGSNLLGTLTTRERIVKFVDKVTTDTDLPSESESSPGKQSRFSLPLSSIAANVGLKLNLGN